jgi:alpha-ketoglutarate-dependent taurine dioxygenase
VHEASGEEVWFNQAHLFHVSALQENVRAALLASMSEHDVPRNAFYGDGSAIDDSTIDEIRRAYQAETVVFEWQGGDVLMLDNMLVAHGRRPFRGTRRVLVGMAEESGQPNP